MFPTKGEANEVLNRPKNIIIRDGKRVKRGINKREEKRAYLCDACDKWHLTSMEIKRKHNMNKRKFNRYKGH